MIIKFADGSFTTIHEGVNRVILSDLYVALNNWTETTKLYTDDYSKSLNPVTNIVFINDFVVDNWLSKYTLQLEKLIYKKLVVSSSQLKIQHDLDLVMDELSTSLFMLDLPVDYRRNLNFTLALIKYFKLLKSESSSAQELFDQLISIHSRVESTKILMLNHADDYDIVFDNDKLKSLHLPLLLLDHQ